MVDRCRRHAGFDQFDPPAVDDLMDRAPQAAVRLAVEAAACGVAGVCASSATPQIKANPAASTSLVAVMMLLLSLEACRI